MKSKSTKTKAPARKLAAITGASSGIGRAVAVELAKKGYDVIVIARRKNLLEELKKEIEAMTPAKIYTIEADLSRPDDLPKLAKQLSAHKIDMFINNAGVGYLGHLVEQDPVRLANILQVLVVALTFLTSAISAQMAKNGGGTIVNVSSGLAYTSVLPGSATYGASKRYVWDLSRAANFENEQLKNNVRVVSVQPGVIASDFSQKAQSDPKKKAGHNMKATPIEDFAKVMVDRVLKGELDFFYGEMSGDLKAMGDKMTPEQYIAELYKIMQRAKANE